MADSNSNDTLRVPPVVTHRTYSDDGLSWPNRKADFIGMLVPLLVLSWAAVALRLYTRLCVVRAPGWDDLFIGLALIFGSISGISLATSINFGMGHHVFELPLDDLETVFLLCYLSSASFTMSNALVKISLLLQYLRTFVDPLLRRLCITLTFITCGYGLAFAFMGWFPCIPVEGFWRLEINSFCYAYGSRDNDQLYLTVLLTNVFNMALDVMIFVLPIPLLFRTDTVRKTKVGLLALFGLGIIINIIAGLRLAANGALTEQEKRKDLTFELPRITILGEAENRLSCILASIPVFWPVFTQKIQAIFVTREFRFESTYQISSSEPGRKWKDSDERLGQYNNRGQGRWEDVEMQAADGKGAMEYQEDEVLEAGVRHPGRLVDVDSYTNAPVRPSADPEDGNPNVLYEARAESDPHK